MRIHLPPIVCQATPRASVGRRPRFGSQNTPLRRLTVFCQVVCLALGFSMMAGCQTTTETGYEPHRLGMSDAQRKALYASPYSQEAQDAQNAHQGGMSKPSPSGAPGH